MVHYILKGIHIVIFVNTLASALKRRFYSIENEMHMLPNLDCGLKKLYSTQLARQKLCLNFSLQNSQANQPAGASLTTGN